MEIQNQRKAGENGDQETRTGGREVIMEQMT